jgi:hypothetical protein
LSTPTGEASAPCSACGLATAAWDELELVERIVSERVQELVTSWPDAEAIEVRRCPCGQIIARKSRRPSDAVRAPCELAP